MQSNEFQTTLSEIASFRRGVSYKGSELAESESDGTPMINMKSFTKEGKYRPEGIKFHNGAFKEKDLIKSDEIILANTDLTKEGDILGAAVMIPVELRGRDVVGSHHTTILTVNDERVNPTFLTRLINSEKLRIEIKRYRRGATVKGITSNDLKKIVIQIPSLAEQKRIVTILNKADEIKQAQNFAFDLRRRLIESTFETLFEPYFVNEDQFVELGELVESVRVGYVGPTSEHYRAQGIHYLRTGNLGYGPVVTDGMKYITQEFHDSQEKSKLKTGDIIISRVIGDEIKCSIIPPELDNSNCGNVVIVTPGQQVNSIFLCHLILSYHTQRKLIRRKVGSAQSVVNTKIMKKMLVPKIPIQLQEQFGAIVETISRLPDPRHLSQKHLDSLVQEILT